MKTRVILFCVIVLAICLWLLLRRATEAPGTAGPQAVAVKATNQNQAVSPKAAVAAQVPSAPAPTAVATNPPTTNGPNAINPTIAEMWQKPIDFYGKVVDENTNPVAGASIEFRWDDLTAENMTRTLATTSYAEGLFSLHGKRGATLIVSVSKEGYYTSHKDTDSYHYAVPNDNHIYSPDQWNPAVFNLRKKGTPEPLMRLAGAMMGPRQYRLDTKGTPTELSFYTGKRTHQGAGQFRVEYWMDVPQDPKQRQFDWRCQVTVPGGGLQAITEEFPFTAPAEGYQEAIEIKSELGSKAWSDRVEQSYYIRLPDDKFGQIKFNLVCSSNPFFGVEALINPSGSKNLEYDKYLPGNIMVDQSAP